MRRVAQPTIMLVEDNSDHALLALEALEASAQEVEVEVVHDGEEALERLAARPAGDLPQVILLDVKMAGLDGFDVLARLKGDARLRAIPVVMLTSSGDAGDISRSYELGSNSYVQKSFGGRELDQVAEVSRYWIGVNTPPPADGSGGAA
jgi:CheY-like chemotaxis protein